VGNLISFKKKQENLSYGTCSYELYKKKHLARVRFWVKNADIFFSAKIAVMKCIGKV